MTEAISTAKRLRARLNDPRRLAAVAESALLDGPPPPALQQLCNTIRTVLDVDAAAIMLVDGERERVVTAAGLPEPWASTRETDLAHSLCQHVVGDGTTVVIADLGTIDLTDGSLAGELGVGAYLGIPLTSADGEVLGATCAISSEPRLWSTREVIVLESLGRTINTLLGTVVMTASAAVSDEVAMVAHDLRNPMSVLVGAGRRLTSNDLDAEVREQLSVMVDRASLQLEVMVDDLLTKARPAERDRPPPREPVDLSRLLRHLALQASASHGVDVDVVGGPSVTIYSDRGAIERIVQNLLDNAIRHGQPPFVLEAATSAGGATLVVSNHGTPIDAETLATLFDRFRPGAGLSSRTGLGLHIVRRLVTSLGGTVDVTDEDGATVFRVELPQRG